MLSRTQAGQLGKSRKKILATTYKPFSESLYIEYTVESGYKEQLSVQTLGGFTFPEDEIEDESGSSSSSEPPLPAAPDDAVDLSILRSWFIFHSPSSLTTLKRK